MSNSLFVFAGLLAKYKFRLTGVLKQKVVVWYYHQIVRERYKERIRIRMGMIDERIVKHTSLGVS